MIDDVSDDVSDDVILRKLVCANSGSVLTPIWHWMEGGSRGVQIELFRPQRQFCLFLLLVSLHHTFIHLLTFLLSFVIFEITNHNDQRNYNRE